MMLSYLFDLPVFISYNPESFSSMIFKKERIIAAGLTGTVQDSYSYCIELNADIMELKSLSDKSIHGVERF